MGPLYSVNKMYLSIGVGEWGVRGRLQTLNVGQMDNFSTLLFLGTQAAPKAMIGGAQHAHGETIGGSGGMLPVKIFLMYLSSTKML